MPRSLSQCPACDEALEPVKLACTGCGLQIEGNLPISRLAMLSAGQQRFVEVFLLVRGNIKEAERELGVSYPTIRKKLDEVVRVLGYPTKVERESQDEILDAIDRGELDPQAGIARLKSQS
jgi:hypothetical protein